MSLKAIEVNGTVDDRHRLHVDELPSVPPGRVKVIILVPEETEADEREWLRAAMSSASFDFLRAPEEDIYTLADGKPFREQG